MGKIRKVPRDPRMPGPAPYITVEEMRRNPALIDELSPGEAEGGPRYYRGTVPGLALKYFKKDWKILDCGAMYGRFVQYLLDEGFTDVHAIDFADMLRYGDRSKFTFSAVDMNTEAFPFPDASFDAVTAWGLPEHMENPFHFLREVHRVLKPEGLYIITFPNIEHIVTRLFFFLKGDMRNYEAHNNHIIIYPRGIFTKSYGRYFDIVEKTYMDINVSLPPYPLFRFISKFLPVSNLFGNHVVYVLRKKPFVPYA
jgi:ubiquinone/menaquinone biosynthesis C-methylase UbiE